MSKKKTVLNPYKCSLYLLLSPLLFVSNSCCLVFASCCVLDSVSSNLGYCFGSMSLIIDEFLVVMSLVIVHLHCISSLYCLHSWLAVILSCCLLLHHILSCHYLHQLFYPLLGSFCLVSSPSCLDL